MQFGCLAAEPVDGLCYGGVSSKLTHLQRACPGRPQRRICPVSSSCCPLAAAAAAATAAGLWKRSCFLAALAVQGVELVQLWLVAAMTRVARVIAAKCGLGGIRAAFQCIAKRRGRTVRGESSHRFSAPSPGSEMRNLSGPGRLGCSADGWGRESPASMLSSAYLRPPGKTRPSISHAGLVGWDEDPARHTCCHATRQQAA
jgi:hypothetical protein